MVCNRAPSGELQPGSRLELSIGQHDWDCHAGNHPKPRLEDPKPRLGERKSIFGDPNPRVGVQRPRLEVPKPRLGIPNPRLGVPSPTVGCLVALEQCVLKPPIGQPGMPGCMVAFSTGQYIICDLVYNMT